MNEMKSSSLGELNLEDFIYWRDTKNELRHSFNLFLHCFGLVLFLRKTKEKEKKLLRDLSHVTFFVNLSIYLWQFLNAVLHWPLFYAWLVLQRIPYASLCLGDTVMCSWYSTGTKIARGKSRISFVYIWHLSLGEKKTAKYSMLLCTWRDRPFQTASKILGDFLKWHYIGQEQKCIIIIMIYTHLSKIVLFLSILLHLYKCLKKRKPRTFWQRVRYVRLLNVAVHSLFGFTLQDRWELFLGFGGKDFHWRIFSRLHKRAVIGCVTALFWVIPLCSLLYTAKLSSQFIRVRQL